MFKRLDYAFTNFANWISNAAGQPQAFVLSLAIVLLWALTGPLFEFSAGWQLVINTGTTIITFLMVFVIQNSQNRDTASMQAKLDELLYAVEGAREMFIGIEHLPASEVEKIRRKLELEVHSDKAAKLHHSVARLQRRL